LTKGRASFLAAIALSMEPIATLTEPAPLEDRDNAYEHPLPTRLSFSPV
jgi:hypothetical protein